MLRVAVLASGNGSNLQALLDRCAGGQVEAHVTLVASDKPAAVALVRARKAKVPAVIALPPDEGETRASYDHRLLDVLQADRPDLVVLAGYMRIVGPALIEAFPGRIINIHPSLLPAFKGLDAVGQAHRAGAKQAGCTVHLVTPDLDGGPTLLQAGLEVRPGEDVDDLRTRILRLEHCVLPRAVQLFAEGRVAPDGQVKAGPSWRQRTDVGLVSGAWYSEAF